MDMGDFNWATKIPLLLLSNLICFSALTEDSAPSSIDIHLFDSEQLITHPTINPEDLENSTESMNSLVDALIEPIFAIYVDEGGDLLRAQNILSAQNPPVEIPSLALFIKRKTDFVDETSQTKESIRTELTEKAQRGGLEKKVEKQFFLALAALDELESYIEITYLNQNLVVPQKLQIALNQLAESTMLSQFAYQRVIETLGDKAVSHPTFTELHSSYHRPDQSPEEKVLLRGQSIWIMKQQKKGINAMIDSINGDIPMSRINFDNIDGRESAKPFWWSDAEFHSRVPVTEKVPNTNE